MKRHAAALVCLAFFTGFAGAAGAPQEKWDQTKVTALSGELANAAAGLENALWNSSQAMDPVMEETVAQVADTVGVFQFEATHLNALLTSGKGMKKTLPAYRRLQELHAELNGYQGQLAVGDFLAPFVTKARTSLTELAKYYPPQP